MGEDSGNMIVHGDNVGAGAGYGRTPTERRDGLLDCWRDLQDSPCWRPAALIVGIVLLVSLLGGAMPAGSDRERHRKRRVERSETQR